MLRSQLELVLSSADVVVCVQLSFRSALESLDPAVSPRCQWASIRTRVPGDRAYDHLDDARREGIFEDVRGDAAASEEQAQAAAAAEAALLRARHEQREKQERELKERVEAGSASGNGSGAATEQENERMVLEKLRADQVCCLSDSCVSLTAVSRLSVGLQKTESSRGLSCERHVRACLLVVCVGL